MGVVSRPSDAMTPPRRRRAFFFDERGGAMRVTWHEGREMVVFSLWRDDVCVSTCRLTLEDAERLQEFLSGLLSRV
jgi:hypothetical protein